MDLYILGWDAIFDTHFEKYREHGLVPARIVCVQRQLYLVGSELGESWAEVSGKMQHEAISRADFPTIGDWVAIKLNPGQGTSTIQAILPRKSSFSRTVEGEEQVVAANIDTLFLVSGLDGDYNLRRIERYLANAWNSGADPVIVLNKCDLCPDIDERLMEIEGIALGIAVHPVSAAGNIGLEALSGYLETGKTVAMLGSSGVGKSSIINRLLGEDRQAVKEVRADDSRGRHTTTHRELIVVPAGGMIIDNPGMRALQLWTDEESLQETYDDIEAMAVQCRFRDCRHQDEPGCAVREALEQNELDTSRYRNYVKLNKEFQYLETLTDDRARRQSAAKKKKISSLIREIKKNR
ncbi:MAG: ribosome small subunit-dependent GTPase A [Proteobacteria bacterium]|nr:ribosome small subunit-dependent GTPase A [Pseudomonadota bacterium]